MKELLAPRLDIPFSRDDTNRFLPWFIALMIFLTALFLAGGITVGEIARHKRQDISQWVTIQLPSRYVSEETVSSAVNFLKAHSKVEQVRVRTREETASLVSPWFGEQDSLKLLPLPTVIEARLEEKVTTDIEAIRSGLKEISKAFTIDDHDDWIEHYLRFVRMVEWAAYLLAILILATAIIMIVFTSKIALKLHQNAVWLLHSVGAVDHYIARQFQFNAFLLGMRGALIGVTPAVALFFVVAVFTNQFESALLPPLPITGLHIIVWLLLPIVTGVLSMAVARKTVLTMLQKIT